jgi:hypothetical protein
LVPCGRAVGQTDMTKLTVAFRSFAKTPKISILCSYTCATCTVYLAEPVPTRGQGSRYKLPGSGGLKGPLQPDYFAYVLVLIVIYRLYKLNHSDQALVTFRFSVKILNQSALAGSPQNFTTGPQTSSQRPWAGTYSGRFISEYVERLLRM